MAALTAGQIDLRKEDGVGQRASLYLFHNVTAGDTVDLSARFGKVYAASGVSVAAPGTLLTFTVTGAVTIRKFRPPELVRMKNSRPRSAT